MLPIYVTQDHIGIWVLRRSAPRHFNLFVLDTYFNIYFLPLQKSMQKKYRPFLEINEIASTCGVLGSWSMAIKQT